MMKKFDLKDNIVTDRLLNGIIKENPTFVLLLGLCPALAVTTSALNGIAMGLITLCVLTFTSLILSLTYKFIPDKLKLPAYIVVIAFFVTIAEVIVKSYLPLVDKALGIYLPLIVVNCIIMSRIENYVVKNKVLLAVLDGIGMGLGFTLALMIIGMIREFLGAGEIFSLRVLPDSFPAATIFVLAPGAFFIMAFLVALHNKITVWLAQRPPRPPRPPKPPKVKKEAEEKKEGTEEADKVKKDKKEKVKIENVKTDKVKVKWTLSKENEDKTKEKTAEDERDIDTVVDNTDTSNVTVSESKRSLKGFLSKFMKKKETETEENDDDIEIIEIIDENQLKEVKNDD